MKKFITTLVISALTLSITLLAGCNTVKGAGRDISNTGRAIERAA